MMLQEEAKGCCRQTAVSKAWLQQWFPMLYQCPLQHSDPAPFFPRCAQVLPPARSAIPLPVLLVSTCVTVVELQQAPAHRVRRGAMAAQQAGPWLYFRKHNALHFVSCCICNLGTSLDFLLSKHVKRNHNNVDTVLLFLGFVLESDFHSWRCKTACILIYSEI